MSDVPTTIGTASDYPSFIDVLRLRSGGSRELHQNRNEEGPGRRFHRSSILS